MMDKNNTEVMAMSDDAIVKVIGYYIKHHRLEQNKTQKQLATEAGLNRSTLVEIEQGKRVNLITIIQLLRALNQLNIFQQFEIEIKYSPIQLAKLQVKERQRAYKVKNSKDKPMSDW